MAKDLSNWLNTCIRQRSLRTLLIIPFVLQIVLAVGATGLFGYYKGRKAIRLLAQDHAMEIGVRITRELQTFLDIPYQINAANADAFQMGLLSFDRPDDLERYFWDQLKRFDTVSYISVGNEAGGLQGVGRTSRGKSYSYELLSYGTLADEAHAFERGTYYLYRADEEGNRQFPAEEINVGYDATRRPWYTVVAHQEEPAWSNIYLYFGQRHLGISASHPLYDNEGNFQGVLATDLELSHLNGILNGLDIGQTGDAFIVDRRGGIVASSTDESPFRLTDTETYAQERRLALESNETLIAHTTQDLITRFGSLAQIPSATENGDHPDLQFVLNLDNQRYFTQVLPFQHQQRLDWLIVVLLPEADFIADIQAMRNRAIAIGLIALTIAILFGIWFLRWITSPIKRLSTASQAIAAGDFSQRLNLERHDDIGVLGHSFNQMTDHLEELFDSLNEQVRDRTLHLEEAKKEAEAANNAKSRFLANMSHELRTPLNGILGYAQVLKRDRQLEPRHQNGLHVIQQCGLHLLSLINDVLDLSKIEANKMETHLSPFAFKDLLQAIADLFQVRADQKAIQFVYSPHPDLPDVVKGDAQKLRQVLINLLGNAIKFTDNGTVTFTVKSVTPNSQSIRFQIEDTGRGITSDDIDEVFIPFQQVGEQRTQEGSGLGLSISQQLVTLMGGTLAVDSKVGEGSRFWVDLDLPMVTGVHCIGEQCDRSSTQRVIGVEGPPRRILIVDDVRENRSFVRELLTSLGFDVAEADNGATGLTMVKTFHPDVILMDLIMPVMDGLTATSTLRHDPAWADFRDTIVIATSASTLHYGKSQSLASGCDDFLLKPLDTDELLLLLQAKLKLKWRYLPEKLAPFPLEMVMPQCHAEQNGAVRIPSQEVLETLWQSARIGDISGILELLEQLNDPELIPFVTELRQRTTQFQVKKIQEFLSMFITHE